MPTFVVVMRVQLPVIPIGIWMTIKFFCPAGHQLEAETAEAGRQVRCPVCEHEVIVPGPAADRPIAVGPTADRPTGGGPPPLPQPVTAARPVIRHLYRPDEGKIASLHWLAFFLGLIATFSAAPAVAYLSLQTAPPWARAVLLGTALQVIFLAWLVATPDWSTLRVLAIVFAVAAALYATVMVKVLQVPLNEPLPWGLEEHRARAPQWCGSVLTLSLLATYLCGRASVKWRRAAELTAR